MSFPNAEKVCRLKEPLQWTPEKQEVMVEACREMAVFHYENSDDIRQLYDARDFDPESVLTEADLNRIPFLGVTAMKHFLFTSMEPDQAVLKLTSSGTSGQKVVLNGGLNLSVLDGWWAEAYDGANGFAIGTGRAHVSDEIGAPRDSEDLYPTIEVEVSPTSSD